MVVAILAGIVAALLMQFASVSLAEYVFGCCMEENVQPLWYAVLSAPLGGFIAIAPGFIAGWLSRSREILAGFLAGLFGSAIYAGTMHTMWPTVVEEGAVVELIARLLALGTGAAIVSAAPAGAAQFLRSNNALHATREDAARDARRWAAQIQ